MLFPNKLIKFEDSVFSNFTPILEKLEEESFSPEVLLHYEGQDVQDITNFIGALDCLFALGIIEYDYQKGVLKYVKRNLL